MYIYIYMYMYMYMYMYVFDVVLITIVCMYIVHCTCSMYAAVSMIRCLEYECINNDSVSGVLIFFQALHVFDLL